MRRPLMLMILVLAVVTPGLSQSGDEIDQIKRSIGSVRTKLRASKQQLEVANKKEQELSRQLGETQGELAETQRVLRDTKLRLTQAETRLDLIRQSIRVTEAKLARAQAALERRLRQIYEQGEVSYLAVLLQSESFTDFLNQTEYLQRILETDRQLIGEVRARKEELERQKEAARRTVLEMRALKETYEQKVAGLEELQRTQARLVAEVQAQREKLSAYVDELEHLTVEMEDKLQRMIREREAPPGSVPVSAGGYVWPVSGPLTSGFGYRVHPIYGTTRFHSGLDFGVDYGTPIRAADHGVVIYSGWYGGYGNTIILSHEGGYSTLYAHCSALYVNVGTRVRQGQSVAAVGSTGNSTGPHLHFEVRKDGTPIDPRSRL